MKCPKCGRDIGSLAQFCDGCGWKREITPKDESKPDNSGPFRETGVTVTGKQASSISNRPHASYSIDFISQALLKHRARFANVIYLESGDPVRLTQLKEFFYSPPSPYDNHRRFIFNPWDGLAELDKKSGKFIGEGKDTIGIQQDTWLEIRTQQCLIHMDSILRKEPTIFIMHGLPGLVGRGFLRDSMITTIDSALKAWATSDDLEAHRSVVFVFGKGTYELLDEDARASIPKVDVEIGNDSDYKICVSSICKPYGITLDKDAKERLKRALRGLNLHESERILREVYESSQTLDVGQIRLSKEKEVKKSGVLEVEDEPSIGFADIGGYKRIKDFIRQKIVDVIRNPTIAEQYSVPLPRGILFFGPPGTGKTLFARAIAKEVQLPFVYLESQNIFSMWLGESEKRTKDAIRLAEQLGPSVVFVDEIDSLGKRMIAMDGATQESNRVFGQMLQWLGDSNRKSMLVGATNRVQDLDPALMRPGRFDYKIPILYPDSSDRLQILQIHFGIQGTVGREHKPTKPQSNRKIVEFLRDKIVPNTEGFSGADLRELVTRAKRAAFERREALGETHFLEALDSLPINRDARKQQVAEYQRLARQFTEDGTLVPTTLSEASSQDTS